MAKYTIELRKISDIYGEETVKSWFSDYKLSDYLTSEEISIIEKHNTWNKEKLANRLYHIYYMREIGYETPALFRHALKGKMNSVMEKYLPIIYTISLDYDLLTNENYTETFKRNYEDTKDTNSNLNSNNKINNQQQTNDLNEITGNGLTINNDTPQGQINKTDILNGTYATSTSSGESTQNENRNQNINSDQTSTTQTSSGMNETGNGNENYVRTLSGNRGILATYQKLIQQYRENIIAVTEEIAKEISDLFMGIY